MKKADMDTSFLKGKIYPMVLKAAEGDKPPEVRISADGSVEFINFTPDADSKGLFELLAKDVGREWRVKAGFEEPKSVYNTGEDTSLNQCDGCAQGLGVSLDEGGKYGVHYSKDGHPVQACTRHLYEKPGKGR
jgi:hypothetical protein